MKKGFTLLELVIATAVLISVFSVIGMAVNRIVKMKKESENQSRVYLQAMTFLDKIEDDLKNISSTNIECFADGCKFYRTITMPRGAKAGEAYTNLPYCSVLYENGASDEYFSGARRSAGTWIPAETATSTEYTTRTAYIVDDTGKTVHVTNAVGGAGEVYIPAASAGDTISIPVVSGSSKHIRDIRSAYSGWAEIKEPEPESITNLTISSGVSFTNLFSCTVVKIIRRPVAGAWPEPGTNSWIMSREATLSSENRTPLQINTPQMYLTDSAFDSVSTNSFEEIVSNVVTVAQEGGPAESVFSTITNHHPVAFVRIAVTNEPSASGANSFYISRTSANPETVAGELTAFYRNAEWLSTLEESRALPSSTNDSVNTFLCSRLNEFSTNCVFRNSFSPYVDETPVPVALVTEETISSHLLAAENGIVPNYTNTLQITAYGSDTNAIMTSASAIFNATVSNRCEVTATNLIFTFNIDFRSETSYALSTHVTTTNTTLSPGFYTYSGINTNGNAISYAENTNVEDLVFDEDFAGVTNIVSGLWPEIIAVESSFADEELLTGTNYISVPVEVVIPPVSAGETNAVPVVSGTATRINDNRSAFSGWVEIERPQPFRTATAGVTFTNSFSSSAVKIVKRPVAGAWPDPVTNSWRITQEAALLLTNSTHSMIFSPPLLMSDSAFDSVSTNFYIEVISNGVVNVDYGIDSLPTNIWVSATNYTIVASVGITVTNEPAASCASAFISDMTSPFPEPRYWIYGTRPPEVASIDDMTNSAYSGVLDVITTVLTNKSDYLEYDAFSRKAEYGSTLDGLEPIPSSPNSSLNEILLYRLSGFAAGYSFHNAFYPYIGEEKIPLAIVADEIYAPHLVPVESGLLPDYRTSLDITATGADTQALLTAVNANSWNDVFVYCEVNEESMLIKTEVDFRSETNYKLETQFPYDAALPAGHYIYTGIETNKDIRTYSEDTDWENLTLDEDFEGATETVTGLWLEDDEVDDTKLRAVVETIAHPVSDSPVEHTSTPKYLDNDDDVYCEVQIIFLSFDDNDPNEYDSDGDDQNASDTDYRNRLRLIQLNDNVADSQENGSMDNSELKRKIPDCADVYLQIKSPNSDSAPSRSTYHFYRRVPLKTRSLWSPP